MPLSPRKKGLKAVVDGSGYLEAAGIPDILNRLVQDLLEETPDDALAFCKTFIEKEISEKAKQPAETAPAAKPAAPPEAEAKAAAKEEAKPEAKPADKPDAKPEAAPTESKAETAAAATSSKEAPDKSETRPSRYEDEKDTNWWLDEGWIDLDKVSLAPAERFIAAVDGSDASMVGFHLCVEYWMQKIKTAKITAVHVFDDKERNQPKLRKDRIRADLEGFLLSSFSKSRYELSFEKKTSSTKSILMNFIQQHGGSKSFVILGHYGGKGKKKDAAMGSTVIEVLQKSAATVIVCHDDDVLPPKHKGGHYVIGVDNNQSSTKAFLDALSISSEGDKIEVVHVLDGEPTEECEMIRNKYMFMFESTSLAEIVKGKTLSFSFLPKKRKATLAMAIAEHAEVVDAQFICIGCANVAEKDKTSAGTVKGAARSLTETSMAVAAELCRDSSCCVMLSQFDDAECEYTIETKKMLRKASQANRRAKKLKHMESYRLNREIDDEEEGGEAGGAADKGGDKAKEEKGKE
jgi:hypothetical protein